MTGDAEGKGAAVHPLGDGSGGGGWFAESRVVAAAGELGNTPALMNRPGLPCLPSAGFSRRNSQSPALPPVKPENRLLAPRLARCVWPGLLLATIGLAGCGRPAGEADAKPDRQPARVVVETEWPEFRGNPSLTGVAPGELSVPLRLQWSFKTGGPVQSSPVVAGGRVFIGSDDGHVYALDLNSGAKIWAFKTGGPVEAPPLALGGRVIAGSGDGNLYALNAEDGALVWSHTTGNKIVAAANWFVLEGATNVLVGSYDYRLHCVDFATGRSNWIYETRSYIHSTPSVAGGQAWVGGCDAVLHGVSLTNGARLAEIPAGAFVAASVALADGRAYFGHYEGQFMSVDLARGKPVWTFQDRSFPYLSAAAVTSDRVLFGGRDKRLHCLYREDGRVAWQFATRGRVDSSPVVCGDKVVFGSDDGRLYVVSLANGRELWYYEIGQAFGSSSPAVAAGLVIIGNEDGSVYCFGPAER